MRSAFVGLGIVVVAIVSGACGGPGSGEPAWTTGAVGTTGSSALTGGCDRDRILSSVSGARHDVLERGFKWIDEDVPYSQSATHEGYRTDCSGFVSMCWQRGTSFTTADYASGGGNSSALGSYEELLPGDALVRRANGSGHIVLFAGWYDQGHTTACLLQEESTKLGMQFNQMTTDRFDSGGFHPIRPNDLPASGGQPSSCSANGNACSADGDCCSQSCASDGKCGASAPPGADQPPGTDQGCASEGDTCGTDGDCCSQACGSDGACAAIPTPSNNGGGLPPPLGCQLQPIAASCHNWFDCCSGSCAFGYCAVP